MIYISPHRCRVLFFFALLLLFVTVTHAANGLVPVLPDVLLCEKTEMVPLQPMGDVLGAAVTIADAAYQGEIKRGDRRVTFTVASPTCLQNGNAVKLPVPPAYRGRTIYVPFRELIAGLDGKVTRNDAQRTITATLTRPDLTVTFRLVAYPDPFDKFHPPVPELFAMDPDGKNLRRLTYLLDDRWPFGFTPDGQAFVSYSVERIYVWKPSDPARVFALPLTPGAVYAPTGFSPDSQWLLYAAGPSPQETDPTKWQIGRIRLDGAGQQQLVEGRFAGYSPDGKSIIYQGWDAKEKKDVIRLLELDGEKTRTLGEGNSPRFSKDGKWIVFLLGQSGAKGTQVGVMDEKGGNRRLLGAGDYPTFSPDGSRLLFYRPGANNTWQNVLFTLEAKGNLFEPTAEERQQYESFGAFSADGKTMLVAVAGKGLVAMDAERGNPKVLTTKAVWTPAFAPDGKRIFCITGTAMGFLPIDGGYPLAFTPYDIEVTSFAVTPDGKRILLTAFPQRQDTW